MGSGVRSELEALNWLQNQDVDMRLRVAIKKVLLQMWNDGFIAGAESAAELTSFTGEVPAQALQDILNQYGFAWIGEITETRMKRIAAALAQGGSAEDLEADIEAILNSEPAAKLIAQTEITRAMSAAALQVYRLAGVGRVRWVTEEDARVCALCDANAAAGPQFLGTPFPSGAIMPPQHGRCRCGLVPER